MAYIGPLNAPNFGSAAPMAVTQTLLDEAEAAYHALITGRAVVKFRDQNGEEVSYNQASRLGLLAYIQDLKRQLGQVTLSPGPMRVWF